jgi:hypothetical protein
MPDFAHRERQKAKLSTSHRKIAYPQPRCICKHLLSGEPRPFLRRLHHLFMICRVDEAQQQGTSELERKRVASSASVLPIRRISLLSAAFKPMWAALDFWRKATSKEVAYFSSDS